MPETENPRDNFLTKIDDMITSGKLVDGATVIVAHDDWCKLMQQGDVCDCNPDIVILMRGGGN